MPDPIDPDLLYQQLDAYRKAMTLTYADLSKITGMPISRICEALTGRVDARGSTLSKLANAMGVAIRPTRASKARRLNAWLSGKRLAKRRATG